ncbi:ABC transporter permease [Arsenicicoccus sp. oral taxon 190]|uniref:ABC transporter permease n=1 Tax=Arsenicicoccus sp. oral taxon 190 TaxID=1658671 RepID=UPI000B0B23F2|nr:ABC transporter permease [Arsenicicoccus sp. oral taxon 190]
MSRPRSRGLLAPLVLGAVLLVAWQLTVSFSGLPGFVLPGPGEVLARLAGMLSGSTVWPYVGLTLAEAVGGCALGAAVALPLAVLVHRSSWANAAITPFLGATQAIPAIALAPLLVLWVGYGFTAIVTLCSLMVFFPILISSVVGLVHVPQEVVDAARIDGAGGWDLLRHVEAPLALPNVLAGIRNGFTLSITGAVVGEMVMGGQGLGTLLTLQRDAVDTAGMFAVIGMLCAIAATAYVLLQVVERRSTIVADVRDTPRG